MAVLPFVPERKVVDACTVMDPEHTWFENYAERLEQIFAALMQGHPHTALESDGHGGTAGFVTRVQAFLHTVRQHDGQATPISEASAALLQPLPAPDIDEEAWVRRQNDRSWDVAATVRDIASEHGVSPAEVALAWVLRRPTVASVTIGVRTMNQLESNLKAVDLHLGDEAIHRLDRASAAPSPYPQRMIDNYGRR